MNKKKAVMISVMPRVKTIMVYGLRKLLRPFVKSAVQKKRLLVKAILATDQ